MNQWAIISQWHLDCFKFKDYFQKDKWFIHKKGHKINQQLNDFKIEDFNMQNVLEYKNSAIF